ncbi:CHAT domain-containing protein [Azospirillum cavernae]|nr:CHAT domain-containing protein [Azospirillum cavernae]
MRDATLDDALAELLAADGLAAKQSILARHAQLLVTAAADARLSDREQDGSVAADGPEIHRALIAQCREQGVDAGVGAFALLLVNLWLDQPTLEAKAALLAVWSDPLLSGPVQDALVSAAESADDPDQAAGLHWHVRLAEHCRDQGLAAGLAAHRTLDGDQPGESAANATAPIDPASLLAELETLAAENRPEGWSRMTMILETLLAHLPRSGSSELDEVRAALGSQLAAILSERMQAGLFATASAASAAQRRAHALYDEALAILRRHERWVEVAATAQNQAILLRSQFKAGDEAAAGRAHALYDEALAIRRRDERWVEVAATAQNQANLLASQFEAGDAAAAGRAHALYDEALAIQRRDKRWVEVATTAQNQANLLQRQFDAGDAAAAGRAHALYDEALAILRRHERWVEVATTAQNQASLLTSQFEAGDAAATGRAHALYDEALAIRRRHKRWVEVATTAQNQASLLRSQFEAGDAAAAGHAHALYGEALAILRRHERWVEVAGTAQNQANLLTSQFEAGDAAAAGRAHALFDEALAWLPFDAVPIRNLTARRNRLRLLEAERDHRRVVDLASVLLADVRLRLPGIAAPRNRRRLLQEIDGLGQRAANSALALGEIEQGLALMEAGRTVELGHRLRDAEALLTADQRALLDDARADLDAVGAVFAQSLHALGEPRGPSGADPHRAVTQAEALLNERAAAFAALRTRLGLNLDQPPPDAVALRAALGPNTVLAAPWFAETGGGLLLLAPGRDGWQRVDRPDMTRDALQTLLEAWFARYHHFHQSDAGAAGVATSAVDEGRQALWRLLMGPLHQAMAALGLLPARGAAMATEIVLCPPPALSVLPLAAATDPETGRAFLDDYALRVAPSLQACLTAAERAARPSPRTLVAVTNPQDDLGVHANPALAFFEDAARIDLTGYHGDPQRAAATADRLRATVSARRPGCFSFYGHGGWDPADPDNSALYLAAPLDVDGAIPQEDTNRGDRRTIGEPFGAAALQGLDLGACRIAVLAGCETGMIDLARNPDEHLGLPAALLQAGAAAVLATLWPVEPESTYAVVTQTLRAVLNDESSPAQALRRAQMRLRDDPGAVDPTGAHLGPKPVRSDSGNNPCPRPSPLWAAFTLVGA